MRRPAAVVALAACLGGLVTAMVVVLRAPPEAPGGSPQQAVAVFAAAEAGAAAGRRVYLVWSPQRECLELRAEGVTLRRFPVSEAQLLRPRWSRGAAGWPAVELRLAAAPPPPAKLRFDGERSTQPSRGAAGLDLREYWRQEALRRAPAAFRLRFTPGLTLEVWGGDRRPLPWTGWAAARRRTLRMLAGGRTGVVLRLRLEESDARRLYLALSPDALLLVEPPPAG